MTIINALTTYLKTYTGLETGAPVWVNFLGTRVVEYSVSPLPGEKIVESYITGGSVREFPFAFLSANATVMDADRLDAIGFFEAFSDWLDSQTAAGILPTLDGGKTPLEIKASNWGYLFEQGESGTGIHQVACSLIYEQP